MKDNEIIKAQADKIMLLESILKEKTAETKQLNGNLKFFRGTVERQKVEIKSMQLRLEKERKQFSCVAKMYSVIRGEAVRGFARFLIEKASAGKICVCDIPDYVVEFIGKEKDNESQSAGCGASKTEGNG